MSTKGWPIVLLLALAGARRARPGGGGAAQRATLEQLVALARKHRFPDPGLAAAIAYAESGGRADAMGDNGSSFGLWQIHLPAHPEYIATRLLEPDYNAAAAFAISASGTNWTPWSTYNQGLHLPALTQIRRGEPNA